MVDMSSKIIKLAEAMTMLTIKWISKVKTTMITQISSSRNNNMTTIETVKI